MHLFRVATMLLLAGAALGQGRPAAVEVEAVEIRALAEQVPIFAEVVNQRDGEVAARVGGVVAEVGVVVGAAVEAGEVLARIDTELLEILLSQAMAQLAQAEAAQRSAQARVDTATTGFERIEGLTGTAAFSQGRFDDAEGALLEALSALAEAEAGVRVAEARLAEARYNRDRADIVAPFAGTVLEVLVTPGEFLQSGQAIARLLDTASFEVEASVPARYAATLAPGLDVVAETEEGAQVPLTVRAVLPLEDGATRTRPARFSGDSADLAAIGQAITVFIPIGAPRDLLSVPKDALVQGPGGWSVFVAAEGQAQPRPVEIGIAVGDRFEVLSGLAEGDLVVTRGNERLRPGQPIAVPGGTAQQGG